MTAKEAEKQEAIVKLRKMIPPGTVVHLIGRHVSRSGMSRTIQPIVLMKGGEPLHLGYLVAKAIGWGFDSKRGGVRVAGCGMDMGFHLVHTLSYALHGMKNRGVREEEAGRPFKPTRRKYRAGYSITHRWL